MQRKPLPAPSKSNKQIQEYTTAVKRGLMNYYVTPAKRGWNVRKADNKTSAKHYVTKIGALSEAKKNAGTGADVILFDKDGSVTIVKTKSSK